MEQISKRQWIRPYKCANWTNLDLKFWLLYISFSRHKLTALLNICFIKSSRAAEVLLKYHSRENLSSVFCVRTLEASFLWIHLRKINTVFVLELPFIWKVEEIYSDPEVSSSCRVNWITANRQAMLETSLKEKFMLFSNLFDCPSSMKHKRGC